MSAVPSDIATLVGFNVITIIGFIGVAALMVRRARNPKTVPRDALEQAMLPKLRMSK